MEPYVRLDAVLIGTVKDAFKKKQVNIPFVVPGKRVFYEGEEVSAKCKRKDSAIKIAKLYI